MQLRKPRGHKAEVSCFEVTSWAEPRAKIQGSNAETLSDENLLSLYLASHTSPRHLPPPGFSDILLRNELDEFIHTEWGGGVSSPGISKSFCKEPDSKYLRLWGPSE